MKTNVKRLGPAARRVYRDLRRVRFGTIPDGHGGVLKETAYQHSATEAYNAARGKQAADDLGLVAVWEDDGDGWASYHAEVRKGYQEPGVERIEGCTVYRRGKDESLAGLYGIEDADDAYRRIVEGELFLEAAAVIRGRRASAARRGRKARVSALGKGCGCAGAIRFFRRAA